jgi:hypothetical protein
MSTNLASVIALSFRRGIPSLFMMFSAQMSMPEATIPKTTEETAMKKAF